jgi:hypothetical protein
MLIGAVFLLFHGRDNQFALRTRLQRCIPVELTPQRKKRSAGRENDLVPAPLKSNNGPSDSGNTSVASSLFLLLRRCNRIFDSILE